MYVDEGAGSMSMLQVLFGVALAAAALFEVYFSFGWLVSPESFNRVSTRLFKFTKDLIQVIQDFRSDRYYIPWSRTQPVIIRSPDHMQALSESPELSQRAVYADIFGFQYTMKHSDLALDPNEQAAHRYRLFSRAIRIAGLDQIDILYRFLLENLNVSLPRIMEKDLTSNGSANVKLAPIVRDLTFGMMAVYFFGGELSAEPEFRKALQRYYQDVIRCSGALQIAPSFLAPYLHSILSRNGHALHVIFVRLRQEVNRIRNANFAQDELGRITLLHNFIASSQDLEYWTPDRLIQAVVGIWFAASHQPWTNVHFLILELCRRPEYKELLRQEIDAQEKWNYQTISGLPGLDSFIKESVRLNPLDLMATRRKALKPFRFPNDGPQLQAGQIACVSSYDIMHDPTRYPNPDSFDGLRFMARSNLAGKGESARAEEPLRGTKLVDGSTDFPIWGFGSKICPGRWHAALVIKMVVVELLKRYDFCLEDGGAKTCFWWDTFQMPYESTRVVFRERTKE